MHSSLRSRGGNRSGWKYWAASAAIVALTGLAAAPQRVAGADKKPAAADAAREQDQAPAAKKWVSQGVHFDDIQTLLKVVPLEQREAILANPDAFKNFVTLESANRSLLEAARANKFEDNPLVKSLMQRGAERVLAETYLNQIIRNNLPKDFPTEAQVKAYYEQNKSKFQTPERVHLWQIYLPVAKDAKKAEDDAVRKKAEGLVRELRRGKLDFATAAEQYSRNQPSRLNGGYMGLMPFSDLVPEVRAKVIAMKADEISDPIKTDDGYHIVRRGGTVAAQTLSYDEIQPQVKQLMVRDAIAKVREAVLKKVQDTYPVQVETSDLEQWRAKLQAENPAPAANPAAGGPAPAAGGNNKK